MKMVNKVQIKVNEKEVPLNQFISNITSKIVLSIVESLKGINDDIRTIQVDIKFSE